jgi:hypothetical protein
MIDPYEEKVEELVPLFDQFNKITSQIQAEIAIALIQNEDIREDLSKKSCLSEEAMMKILNRAIYTFIGSLPLAQINQSNMFLTALGQHSEITGDPLFSDVINKLQELNEERYINESYDN